MAVQDTALMLYPATQSMFGSLSFTLCKARLDRLVRLGNRLGYGSVAVMVKVGCWCLSEL